MYLCSSQGYDPLAKEKFKPKSKKKGRSSAGAIEKRKRKVAYEDQRVFTFLFYSFTVHKRLNALGQGY